MTRNRLVTATAVLAALLIVYAWNSYSDVFSRRLGFVYHPESDRIFRVDFAPTLHRDDKWTPFIPFQSLFFGEIERAEYLGLLVPLLGEIRADRELLEQDIDRWLKKNRFELENMISELQSDDLEFWDIEYFARHDVDANILLPQVLLRLREFTTGERPDVFPADIVVSRWRPIVPSTEIEILRHALIIRGRAVSLLVEEGLEQH